MKVTIGKDQEKLESKVDELCNQFARLFLMMNQKHNSSEGESLLFVRSEKTPEIILLLFHLIQLRIHVEVSMES